MTQALHIFRKDVRHLRFEIAAALVLAAAFAVTGVIRAQSSPAMAGSRSMAWALFPLVFPLTWWLLIERAIHDEALPGDRQFWTTRPYRWPSLLAAKALFIAVFANLPLLAAQIAILLANGFSLGPLIPALLWNQVILTAVVFLPMAAFAALTRGIVQLLLGSLALFIVAVATFGFEFGFGNGWGPTTWIVEYAAGTVAALGALAVLLGQYWRRRTAAGVLAGGLVLILIVVIGAALPWSAAYTVQSTLSGRRTDSPAVSVALDSGHRWAGRALVEPGGQVRISIPVHVQAPNGVTWNYDGIEAAIASPGRAHRLRGVRLDGAGSPGISTVSTAVDSGLYRAIKDQPVTIRGALFTTLYGQARITRIPFSSRNVPVPGVGVCTATSLGNNPTHFFTCNSALKPIADMDQMRFISSIISGSPAARVASFLKWEVLGTYSVFPAEFSLNPVHSSTKVHLGPLESVITEVREPMAHVRSAFELTGIRLADFEQQQQKAHP
jgi:hypothetical protein